jgi:hypothetical protein
MLRTRAQLRLLHLLSIHFFHGRCPYWDVCVDVVLRIFSSLGCYIPFPYSVLICNQYLDLYESTNYIRYKLYSSFFSFFYQV